MQATNQRKATAQELFAKRVVPRNVHPFMQKPGVQKKRSGTGNQLSLSKDVLKSMAMNPQVLGFLQQLNDSKQKEIEGQKVNVFSCEVPTAEKQLPMGQDLSVFESLDGAINELSVEMSQEDVELQGKEEKVGGLAGARVDSKVADLDKEAAPSIAVPSSSTANPSQPMELVQVTNPSIKGSLITQLTEKTLVMSLPWLKRIVRPIASLCATNKYAKAAVSAVLALFLVPLSLFVWPLVASGALAYKLSPLKAQQKIRSFLAQIVGQKEKLLLLD